jgi:hypothetical protein
MTEMHEAPTIPAPPKRKQYARKAVLWLVWWALALAGAAAALGVLRRAIIWSLAP